MTSHYLNQWRLNHQCIYVSLGLNELSTKMALARGIKFDFFFTTEISEMIFKIYIKNNSSLWWSTCMEWGMPSGGQCWNYYTGSLSSQSGHCKSLGRWGISRWNHWNRIFKWVMWRYGTNLVVLWITTRVACSRNSTEIIYCSDLNNILMGHIQWKKWSRFLLKLQTWKGLL